MPPLFSVLLGFCVGSFLNVCLFRWKSGGHIFFPPSSCQCCHSRIRWFDNIPIISFFLLKGRCRYCSSTISIQYPLIEMVTGIFFGACAFFGNQTLFFQLASFLFVSFLVLLVSADLKWKLLPHPFTNFFILFGLGLQIVIRPLDATFYYLIASGFVVVGGVVFLLISIFPEVLGGGDIKMLLALSVWLGIVKSLCVLVIAFGVGAFVALLLILIGKIERKSTMPFGPFLALGAYGVWFFPDLLDRLRMGL